MKRILFLFLFLLSFSFSYCQPGIGWIQQRAKVNFNDSTRYTKNAAFNSTLNVPEGAFRIGAVTLTANGTELNILDGALVTTAELNYLVNSDSNIQTQIDGINSDLIDTLALSDLSLLKHVEFHTLTVSDTLILTDDGRIVQMNLAGANNCIVPTNTAVAFPIGTQVTVVQIGAGQTSIVAASGVTINSSGGKLKLTGQYSAGTLIKTSTNVWLLIGDIDL